MRSMHSCVKFCLVLYTLQQLRTSLELPVQPEAYLLGATLDQNAQTSKSFVEGDIKLTEVEPYQSELRIDMRSTVTDKAKVWTNGIVPYIIDSTFFTEDQLKIIEAAMKEIHDKTCVKFVRRRNEMPYLFISVLSRCWSEIGMPPEEGIRTLSLGTACMDQRGTVIHELLHILGFWHEQNRPDRDDYVTVNWQNIADGMEHNFIKYSADKVDTLNEPYDYGSIMHYASFAFAKDVDAPTIEPRIPIMIGQRFELSRLDVRKINKLYKCTARPNSATAWNFRPSLNDSDLGSAFSSLSSSSSSPEVSSSASSTAEKLDPSRIVFPPITEFIPLPFRFNWSDPVPKEGLNGGIVFPKDR